MKKTLVLLGCMILAAQAGAQSSSEKISRELSFEKKGSNAVMIFNINGSVKVEGYAGDKVMLEVEKKITAKTDARLALGKEEIQLGVMDRADTLIFYVKGSCSSFGKQTDRRNYGGKYNGWGYDWNRGDRSRDCEDKYDYAMNFTVKVPAGVSVMAYTINGGDVEVSMVSGKVDAENINGSILLTGISNATRASTINGNVNLDFSGNPPGDSRFYTLNGDITANFRKGLGAQLAFKSFNGDLYSSLDEITPMSVQLEKTDRGGMGTHYRVNGNRYQVRQGGPLLDFETFNGDVIIKEKEN